MKTPRATDLEVILPWKKWVSALCRGDGLSPDDLTEAQYRWLFEIWLDAKQKGGRQN